MNKDTWSLDSEIGNLDADTPLSVLIGYKAYTSSQDKKGHEAFLGAKFPKEFARWRTRLRERSEIYQTNADVVRDAIYLGLIIISLRNNSLAQWRTLVAVTQAHAAIFEDARIFKECEELADDLVILVSNNDLETAAEHLRAFKASLDSCPPKYTEALKRALSERRLQNLLAVLDE